MSNQDLIGAAKHYCTPYYMQPERFYHTLTHVQNILEALETRDVLSPALALAVWGHDLIYDTRQSDNELRSADLFDQWLTRQGADDQLRAEVERLILATRHLSPPGDRASALLIDADLGIFGADEAQFWTYERAIRQEYGWVAPEAYRTGRRAVLEGFLSRPAIYNTPEFAALEPAARTHLEQALAALTDPDATS